MKKLFVLLTIAGFVNACVPYNNYYSKAPQTGYYNGGYPNYQEGMYSHNYEQGLPGLGYDEPTSLDNSRNLDNMVAMQKNAVPVQQVAQQTVYQELPQNPTERMQIQSQQSRQYYNQAQNPTRTVVGVGQTMNYAVAPKANRFENSKTTLIIPRAWRMAHPSIGKGLELAEPQERFELNSAINKASTKRPMDVHLAGEDITLISLDDSSSANVQGFMCKKVYLLKAENGQIKRMWGQFCRHPNWNEWVLTSW